MRIIRGGLEVGEEVEHIASGRRAIILQARTEWRELTTYYLIRWLKEGPGSEQYVREWEISPINWAIFDKPQLLV